MASTVSNEPHIGQIYKSFHNFQPSSTSPTAMHSCVLVPPYTRTLSDKLICDVEQRTEGPRAISVAKLVSAGQTEANIKTRPYLQQLRYHPHHHTVRTDASHVRVEASTATRELSPEEELITPNDISSSCSLPMHLPSDVKTANKIIATIKASNHPIDANLQNVIIAEALKKKIRHREHCRANQARYRAKHLKFVADTQNAIVHLRKEIEDLKSRCRSTFRIPTSQTPWTVAADYFRHFNNFVACPGTQQEAASKFLRGIMAPDTVDGVFPGVNTQIENWRRFALFFGDTRLELRGMEMPTERDLVASTSINITLSWNTLRYAFPHMNSDGKGGTQGGDWSPIATRILGLTLVVRGSVIFGWDDTSDEVVRFHAQADLLTPLLNVLGSLADVSLFFSEALITPDGNFI